MYAIVQQFLDRLGADEEEFIQFAVRDNRVAAAVLLFRVVTADGLIREPEMVRYRELLQDRLDVSPDELALFESIVREEAAGEKALAPYVALVADFPVATKRHLLDMMRDISISDSEFHEIEINLVTRTAELLDIPVDG